MMLKISTIYKKWFVLRFLLLAACCFIVLQAMCYSSIRWCHIVAQKRWWSCCKLTCSFWLFLIAMKVSLSLVFSSGSWASCILSHKLSVCLCVCLSVCVCVCVNHVSQNYNLCMWTSWRLVILLGDQVILSVCFPLDIFLGQCLVFALNIIFCGHYLWVPQNIPRTSHQSIPHDNSPQTVPFTICVHASWASQLLVFVRICQIFRKCQQSELYWFD